MDSDRWPTAYNVLLGVPALVLLVSRRFSQSAPSKGDVALVVGLECVILALSAFSVGVTAAVWSAIRMSAPPLIVIASAVALKPDDSETSALRRSRLYLLASVAAWCGLSQFPTDSYQYFLYVLPLFIYAGLALAEFRGTLARSVAVPTLLAFMALGVLIRPVFIHGGDPT